MTDTIKRLRIYTDEAAYFGDQKVFEVVALRARAAAAFAFASVSPDFRTTPYS